METRVNGEIDDLALAARVRAGDSAAFRELYDRVLPVVHAAARLYSPTVHDAEDLTQDVFVGLPEALMSYAGRGSLEGWVRRVTVRAALMRRRSDSRRQERERKAHLDLAPAERPDLRMRIERAVGALDPDVREVLLLRVLEGWSHDEIAAHFSISNRASRARLHRARMKLRQLWMEGEE